MARQLLSSRIPVDLSIVEFDFDDGEELFLTYTWERAEGPGITRDGIGPPKMRLVDKPKKTTAHPMGLRLGCWLVRAEMVEKELDDAKAELAKVREKRLKDDEAIVKQTIDWLEEVRDEIGGTNTRKEPRHPRAHNRAFAAAHDRAFVVAYPEYELVAQQGCGDLTMNTWNVAYVNNPLGGAPPALVYLSADEPLEDRTYSCLVKWKPSVGGVKRVTIEDAQFSRFEKKNVKVRYDRDWLPRGDGIDFAVSNQQVIREGAVVPIVTTCQRFSDVRHLLQLPNVNPDGPLYPSEVPQRPPGYRPRHYANDWRSNDIWLAENVLIPGDFKGENLLREALSGPILLELPLEMSELSIRGALTLARYREVANELDPLSEGDWRFVSRDGKTLLEVYFRRNTYGWSMIGLSADNRKMYWLACSATPGVSGFKLEDAARELRDAGAWNALLIDEGLDAMQSVRLRDELEELIPRKRQRLRSTFIVGKPR